MKQKIFVFIALCSLSAIPASAQIMEHRENLEIGIKAGVNISNVWDSKTEQFNVDPKAGIASGIFVAIPIGKFLGIQPEAMLSQKGFKGSGTLLGQPYSFIRTTTYLDIPLQLQLKPAEFVTLLFGPQYSYLLNQKDKYTLGINSTEQEQQFKNENLRKNILGFVAGADIIYQHIVLSGRIGWDFQSNNGDGTSITPRYKNQWVQFTIGFKV